MYVLYDDNDKSNHQSLIFYTEILQLSTAIIEYSITLQLNLTVGETSMTQA